jgi:hypothetical protein
LIYWYLKASMEGLLGMARLWALHSLRNKMYIIKNGPRLKARFYYTQSVKFKLRCDGAW